VAVREVADAEPSMEGRVVMQGPAAGTEVQPGTGFGIWVGRVASGGNIEPGSTAYMISAGLSSFADAHAPNTQGPGYLQAPVAEEVLLALGSEVVATRTPAELDTQAGWVVDLGDFRGRTGEVFVLEHLQGAGVSIRNGPQPRCVGDPTPAPAELVGLERFTIEPPTADIGSCLEWWSLTVYLDADGRIAGVVYDLFEP
jgi:hypothetical protein